MELNSRVLSRLKPAVSGDNPPEPSPAGCFIQDNPMSNEVQLHQQDLADKETIHSTEAPLNNVSFGKTPASKDQEGYEKMWCQSCIKYLLKAAPPDPILEGTEHFQAPHAGSYNTAYTTRIIHMCNTQQMLLQL